MKKQNRSKDFSATVSRKRAHVELVVSEQVEFRHTSTGFDRLRFLHNALPEIALSDVDTHTIFLGKQLKSPILISSMTGGYKEAEEINSALGRLAKVFGVAVAAGSQRQALENKSYHNSFKVLRKENPSGVVFSNIGAVELVKIIESKQIAKLQMLIGLLEADGLIIHLNALQELMQPEGEPNFRGVLKAIAECAKKIRLPIIVKEVGAGISKESARRLVEAGVRVIDLAGAGGTSWAGVEILRRKKKERSNLEPFWDWGIPTVDALLQVQELRNTMTFGLISSGGIQDGIDIAKSIALGADLVGIAKPLITAYMTKGEKELHSVMEVYIQQLKYTMFLTGSATIDGLSKQPLQRF
ncbi:MAG: type 2 isopentenyl-diphosphate Delta-isomerase [bacterium]